MLVLSPLFPEAPNPSVLDWPVLNVSLSLLLEPTATDFE